MINKSDKSQIMYIYIQSKMLSHPKPDNIKKKVNLIKWIQSSISINFFKC